MSSTGGYIVKRIMLFLLVAVDGLWANAQGEPVNRVDSETMRIAQERLNAKASTQPSEVERLKKELKEVKAELADLKILYADRKLEIAQLRKEIGIPEKGKVRKDTVRKGMSFEEVVAIKGKPSDISNNADESMAATWVTFIRGGETATPISGGGTAAVVSPGRDVIGDPLGINPTSRRTITIVFMKNLVVNWREEETALR